MHSASATRAPAGTSAAVAALLYGLVFLAALAQTALVPLLPRLAGEQHLSSSAAAALIAAPGAATLAIAIPAGLLADRFGARRVTLAAGVLLAVGVLCQAAPGYGWLLTGRLTFGLAYGIVWTTAVAWMARLDADGDRAARRQGVTVTSAAVGIAAGPAFGALLAGGGGFAAPFLAAGIAAAAVTVALTVASREQSEAAAPSHSPTPARPAAGLARAGRPLAGGALTLAISGAINAVVQLLVPLQLHAAGATTQSIGLAFSCAAGLYIAVSAVVVRLGRRAVTSRTNALAALVLALALLPAGWSGSAVAALITLMLTVAPRATVSTIAYPLAADDAARAGIGHGTAVGLLNGAWAGAVVAAPFAATAMSHWAGMRAAWLGMLGLGIAGAAWLLARESRPQGRLARRAAIRSA
jgi:predicted MFS family arabinose efflux permease